MLLLVIPAGIVALYALRADVDETAAVSASADGGRTTDGPTDGVREADERESGHSSLRSFVIDSRTLFASSFLVVFGIVMLSGLYYRGVLTFLPEILTQFPTFDPIQVGTQTLEPANYFYAGLLMIGILSQYVGGRLTDRMPTDRGIAIAFGALFVVAILFLPAASLGLGPFLVVGALIGFFLFAVQPMYQATVAEYTPPSARGLSYGYTYLGVFGVGATGEAIAGIVITIATARELFFVLAAFAATAVVLGYYLYTRTHRGAR